MTRVAWLVPFLIVASLAACKRKPQDDPATTRTSDAKPLPDRGSADVLPAQKVTPVGAPLAADVAVAAGAPAIEVDAEGKPVVAWIEGGKVMVRRWDGAAWQPLAELPNQATQQAKGVPVLAREDQGLLLGWIESGADQRDSIHTVRWKDGAWAALGSPSTPAVSALDVALASSEVGPVVVWREPAGPAKRVVRVAVHGAQGWAPLGGGTLQAAPEGTTEVAPALATRAGGLVVVGWIEQAPAPMLHVRRWNRAASTWDTLPAPPGADAHSTLSMTATANGTLYAALGFVAGLRQLASFSPGAMEWTRIGVPESANGQILHQRVIAGDDGRVVFTYPFGGRFAYWDGRRWNPTSVGVVSPSVVVPVAAGTADGKVYVAWSDSPPGSKQPDRVSVFVVE